MKRADRDFTWLSLATAASIALGIWQWLGGGDRVAGALAGVVAVSYAAAFGARAWTRQIERRHAARLAELDALVAELAHGLDRDLTEIARMHTRAPADVLVIPRRRRVILDLCAGSGAWSDPYKRAGYRVVRVTLPRRDVRTFVAKGLRVWGIVAAPPCTEFSLVRNGSKKPRDFAGGMECVNAVLRIVQQTRPQWWALENPVGMLSQWLGTPRDVFDPCDFGDPWTKRTALWGSFACPERGPFVRPIAGKTALVRAAADRAITPAGFARAFFKANP